MTRKRLLILMLAGLVLAALVPPVVGFAQAGDVDDPGKAAIECVECAGASTEFSVASQPENYIAGDLSFPASTDLTVVAGGSTRTFDGEVTSMGLGCGGAPTCERLTASTEGETGDPDDPSR
jgi:hypothetical protein